MTFSIWKKSYAELMQSEGGYVNNPNDKGGSTYCGVTQKSFDAWNKKHGYAKKDIRESTEQEREQLYYEEYWCSAKCDFYPDAISFIVFDFGVNASPKRAVKFLQKCLNITADGVAGNQTIGSANRCNVKQLIKDYSQMKREYYDDIVKKNPTQKVFIKGWHNRVNRVEKICEEICQ